MKGLAALLVLVALAFAGSSAAGGSPRVRLTDRSPAILAGTGFHAQERVSVVVSSGEVVLRKAVTAGARGTIVARWARSLPAACNGTAIVARGSAGSRAVFKDPPTDCAPIQPVNQ